MMQESTKAIWPTGPDLLGIKQEVVVRSLRVQDLTEVANIHRIAFPDSALTKLGVEAVRRYYLWLLEGPHDAIQLGAFVNSEVVGFCFAGVFRGAMSGFLRANRFFLCSQVLRRPWIAANQILRQRLVGALRILRKHKGSDRPSTGRAVTVSRPFGILAIAVSPNRQGLGVGKLLMKKSEDAARDRGFQEMILTVNTSNDQAIKFYENLQWAKSFSQDVWQGAMRKRLQVPNLMV